MPTGITVLPRKAVFARSGEKQGLVVLASYSDGSQRDVTDLAVFISNNDAAATVSDQELPRPPALETRSSSPALTSSPKGRR